MKPRITIDRQEEKFALRACPAPRRVHGHGTTFDPAELEHPEHLLAANVCVPFDALHRKVPVTWTLTQQQRSPRSEADCALMTWRCAWGQFRITFLVRGEIRFHYFLTFVITLEGESSSLSLFGQEMDIRNRVFPEVMKKGPRLLLERLQARVFARNRLIWRQWQHAHVF